jgi:hypothetical protein
MHGPQILVDSMTVPQPRGTTEAMWQYHSRSDLHSKVACWGAFFDLLRTSALLKRHADTGKVVFGVNFEMRDYTTGRKKDLDLVIARPSGESTKQLRTLGDLAEEWGVALTPSQYAELDALPPILEGGVVGSAVLVALEAKAAMTAHSKARPRLYDELNSSHLTVHGASSQALAVGLVMVNAAERFISPGLQADPDRGNVSEHTQPAAAEGVVRKMHEIPRRTGSATHGFDGLGIVVVEAANDGTPVTLVETPPAPQPGDIFRYDEMLTRVANEYDTRFAAI